MNILERLERKITVALTKHQLRKKASRFDEYLSASDAFKKFNNRNDLYNYFAYFFYNNAPNWLRKHRKFYSKKRRGFGEDAFHAFWFLLVQEIRPKNFLEIGVYRGQSLSLVKKLCTAYNSNPEVLGISPFQSIGDEVSEYIEIDYLEDTIQLSRQAKVEIKKNELLNAFSEDQIAAERIKKTSWELIYIDGNHNYENVKRDIEICSAALVSGGILVLDDSALYTDLKPSHSIFAGHPGPSRAVDDLLTLGRFVEFSACGHLRALRKL